MSSQSYLWLNLGFALLIAMVFIIGRSRMRAPSRLNLKNKWSKNLNFYGSQGYQVSKEAVGESFSHREIHNEIKSLNVIFMYNGHNWDAHEVLGVPAGSRMEVVTAAFQKAIANSDMGSKEFIETAYHAITKK